MDNFFLENTLKFERIFDREIPNLEKVEYFYLEVGARNVCAEGVELVHRVLVFVAATRQANTDAEGHVPENKNIFKKN